MASFLYAGGFGFKANYEKVTRQLSELLRTKENVYCEETRWPACYSVSSTGRLPQG